MSTQNVHASVARVMAKSERRAQLTAVTGERSISIQQDGSTRQAKAVAYVIKRPLLHPSDVADILDAAGTEIWYSMLNCNGNPSYDLD